MSLWFHQSFFCSHAQSIVKAPDKSKSVIKNWFSYFSAKTYYIVGTVKAPSIAHLSLLTVIGYNKKETKLKKCAQPNNVIINYYLHGVQNEKKFPNL